MRWVPRNLTTIETRDAKGDGFESARYQVCGSLTDNEFGNNDVYRNACCADGFAQESKDQCDREDISISLTAFGSDGGCIRSGGRGSRGRVVIGLEQAIRFRCNEDAQQQNTRTKGMFRWVFASWRFSFTLNFGL
jgi:hypothetical protein